MVHKERVGLQHHHHHHLSRPTDFNRSLMYFTINRHPTFPALSHPPTRPMQQPPRRSPHPIQSSLVAQPPQRHCFLSLISTAAMCSDSGPEYCSPVAVTAADQCSAARVQETSGVGDIYILSEMTRSSLRTEQHQTTKSVWQL